MVLADLHSVVLGTIAFTTFWVLAVFPSFKLLPIGRTAGAVGGAVLTVVFQVLSPRDAYAAIDLSILGLLFGTMVVGAYLERADLFKYLAQALSWRSQGGKDLLCRVCILSAISSALFTNDTSCVVLTEFVLTLCRQKSLRPKPFLIALASSANIGSVATPIGNPQNLVIAVQSGISFGKFLMGLLPCMLLGVFVNTMLLLAVYWRQLSPLGNACLSLDLDSDAKIKSKSSEFLNVVVECPPDPPVVDALELPKVGACEKSEPSSSSELNQSPVENKASPGTLEPQESTHVGLQMLDIHEILGGPQDPCSIKHSVGHPSLQEIHEEKLSLHEIYGEDKPSSVQTWKRRAWKCAVYMITVGMLAALLYGLDLSWSALTAAVAMMALDFQDAAPNLDKVSYPLLVFFAGMFITVNGFNTTGIPGTFWDIVEPHARINSGSGIMMLALVVIILSNVASNVPTVLLLGSRVSASAAIHGGNVVRSWLTLAWTSTVAGNLTLVGSAANLIVSEQAAKAQLLGYELTFWNHFMFGFPSTLVVAAIGLFTIRG